jgi:hypothetical protein
MNLIYNLLAILVPMLQSTRRIHRTEGFRHILIPSNACLGSVAMSSSTPPSSRQYHGTRRKPGRSQPCLSSLTCRAQGPNFLENQVDCPRSPQPLFFSWSASDGM